jgi:hypothetical protein
MKKNHFLPKIPKCAKHPIGALALLFLPFLVLFAWHCQGVQGCGNIDDLSNEAQVEAEATPLLSKFFTAYTTLPLSRENLRNMCNLFSKDGTIPGLSGEKISEITESTLKKLQEDWWELRDLRFINPLSDYNISKTRISKNMKSAYLKMSFRYQGLADSPVSGKYKCHQRRRELFIEMDKVKRSWRIKTFTILADEPISYAKLVFDFCLVQLLYLFLLFLAGVGMFCFFNMKWSDELGCLGNSVLISIAIIFLLAASSSLGNKVWSFAFVGFLCIFSALFAISGDKLSYRFLGSICFALIASVFTVPIAKSIFNSGWYIVMAIIISLFAALLLPFRSWLGILITISGLPLIGCILIYYLSGSYEAGAVAGMVVTIIIFALSLYFLSNRVQQKA